LPWQCVHIGFISIACVLVRPASASNSGRFLQESAQPSEDDKLWYAKLPGTPSEEMVVEQNEAAQTAQSWAYTVEATSAMRAKAAESLEASKESELLTMYHNLDLKSATMDAILSVQRTTEMQKRADAAARRAERLVAQIPQIADQAAKRAIGDTIGNAIQRMNMEATLVAEEQKRIEMQLAKDAAKAAQIAALPWQQAKVRASQTMISYASQARDLANAVTHLKLKAPGLSKQAGVLQARGDVVHAQQLQIAAHDLLDKAGQLESQAKSFDKTARKIDTTLGMYDLSAQAAAAYAAYTTNPGAGAGRSDLPPLPPPLHLLNLGGGPGPAPAPAPASSPVSAPGPGPAPAR
jgi:hypothetical protein